LTGSDVATIQQVTGCLLEITDEFQLKISIQNALTISGSETVISNLSIIKKEKQ
jgi:hypothetical protein